MLDQNVAREVLQEAVRTGGDFAEIFMEDRIDHAMGMRSHKLESATTAGVPGGVADVNQPSICLYFAPCADLTSLRIVPEGEAGFTLNLSGEKGTE